MKANIIDQESTFKSFKLEIEVESIEEARLWYHVFNRGGLKEAIFDNKYSDSSNPYDRIHVSEDFTNIYDDKKRSIYKIIAEQINLRGFKI